MNSLALPKSPPVSEHTQTPWFVVRNDDGDLSLGTSLDDPWYIAAMCLGCDGDEVKVDPAEANAAFIAKAVNSHDALVEALREIRKISANPGNQALTLTKIFDLATRASRLEFDGVVGSPKP
jgi:hypothetical protein